MNLTEALTILKQNADGGERALRQIEANLEAVRRNLGATADQQLAVAKQGIEAARVVVAWVEEKLGQ